MLFVNSKKIVEHNIENVRENWLVKQAIPFQIIIENYFQIVDGYRLVNWVYWKNLLCIIYLRWDREFYFISIKFPGQRFSFKDTSSFTNHIFTIPIYYRVSRSKWDFVLKYWNYHAELPENKVILWCWDQRPVETWWRLNFENRNT